MKVGLLLVLSLLVSFAASFAFTLRDGDDATTEREGSFLAFSTIEDLAARAPVIVRASLVTERAEQIPESRGVDRRVDQLRTFKVTEILKGADGVAAESDLVVRSTIEVHQRATGAVPAQVRRGEAPPVRTGVDYLLALQSGGDGSWIYWGHPSHAQIEDSGTLVFWSNAEIRGHAEDVPGGLLERSTLAELRRAIANPRTAFVPPDLRPVVDREVARRFDALVAELGQLRNVDDIRSRAQALRLTASDIGNDDVCLKYEAVIRELSGQAGFTLDCKSPR
jgi:hypothetical protein